jgi:cytochrome c oxidase subunit 2
MDRFFPIAASEQAAGVDRLFTGLLIVAALVTLLVLVLILTFAIRYQRGSAAFRGPLPEVYRREFEVGWTAATLLLFLFLFWWASSINLSALVPPTGAMDIRIVAKQWMWKAQHGNGAREINEVHVPIGTPVRLTMESQDVIHSFFVPEFRIKQDVVPGLRTQTWFTATKLGTFQILCTEYCGTDHSAMRGRVVVMRAEDFATWLSGQAQGIEAAHRGAALFEAQGCAGCHAPTSSIHAPRLAGVFGSKVTLADGRTVTADQNYIRDSILEPGRDVVAGYEPIMPSYAEVLSEDELESLIAYVRSLGTTEAAQP